MLGGINMSIFGKDIKLVFLMPFLMLAFLSLGISATLFNVNSQSNSMETGVTASTDNTSNSNTQSGSTETGASTNKNANSNSSNTEGDGVTESNSLNNDLAGADVWDGAYPTVGATWASIGGTGAGTEADPYIVDTAQKLAWISSNYKLYDFHHHSNKLLLLLRCLSGSRQDYLSLCLPFV